MSIYVSIGNSGGIDKLMTGEALDRTAAEAQAARMREALEEIKRNGSGLSSRAPVIASAVLADPDPVSPFGQDNCQVCGWANHELRKKCRHCNAALAPTAGETTEQGEKFPTCPQCGGAFHWLKGDCLGPPRNPHPWHAEEAARVFGSAEVGRG